jgi:hypothetical protein
MAYDRCRMNKETLILALQRKLREDMDTPENVHYNEGIIAAIEVVEKQFAQEKAKQSK